MNYLSLSKYLKQTFGCKVYKLAIDGGFSCPNRDGLLGTGGCIFCSGFGSGDFAASRNLSVTVQIETAKYRVRNKIHDGKYIAYFQAFTNTYAPVDVLRKKFTEAINHPDIVAVSIGTRPDCLSDDVLNLLSELNEIKPVWVELGLQTIHNDSAAFIRRGYELSVFDTAIKNLKARNIYIITHVILGLPGETEEMMLETVKYVCSDTIQTDGIKLQLLHIIKGTDLGNIYEYFHKENSISEPVCEAGLICEQNTVCERNNLDSAISSSINSLVSDNPAYFQIMKNYECMELNEYADLIKKCISVIPITTAIHRMTGDGDKKTLIAPLWSGDKKRVLNEINKRLN